MEKPDPYLHSTVMARIVSGMAIPSRRQVVCHERHAKGRSIFSPEPINAISTTACAICSDSSLDRAALMSKCIGPINTSSIPINTITMGTDNGNCRTASGSHATSSIRAPRNIYRAFCALMGGSDLQLANGRMNESVRSVGEVPNRRSVFFRGPGWRAQDPLCRDLGAMRMVSQQL